MLDPRRREKEVCTSIGIRCTEFLDRDLTENFQYSGEMIFIEGTRIHCTDLCVTEKIIDVPETLFMVLVIACNALTEIGPG
jgi:hypothetical protein